MTTRSTLLVGMALGLFLVTRADAVSTCKATANLNTGAIAVSATGVGASPKWGATAGTINVTFPDLACFNPIKHTLKNCLLGAPDTLAASTPPEACVIFVNDVTNVPCHTFIKRCTPGARLRDASFTDPNDPRALTLANQASQIAAQASQIAALTAQDTSQNSQLASHASQIATLTAGLIFHPYVVLTGADLSNVDLSSKDLTGANLSYTNLTGANLTGTILTAATLQGLRAVNLSGGCPASLPTPWQCVSAGGLYFLLGPSANLTGVDLTGADLTGVNLNGTNLASANLTNANLTGVDLSSALLNGTNLSGATLTNANLSFAYVIGSNLTNANLTNANLSYMTGYLPSSDLTGANLTNANLYNAQLYSPNLTNANLTSANLSFAYLDSVTWSSTTCGDGTSSNGHGNTCCGGTYFPAGEPYFCSP